MAFACDGPEGPMVARNLAGPQVDPTFHMLKCSVTADV